LAEGNCFLGIILASDKTPLTIGTGGKEMHPILLSLANIDAGVRMKLTSRAFALIGYLPIPKFRSVTTHEQSILSARVYHHCLDIITDSLKKATLDGEPMVGFDGKHRVVHTPLASWIADYQEQLVISCVSGQCSPVMLASKSQFGDAFPHPPRTRSFTLNRIATACTYASPTPPCDEGLERFWKICQALELSGVHQPVWRDWGSACPSIFLTHDALHGLHKFFYDHPLKWAINIMGGCELDCRLMALQPCIGVQHWGQGISNLKQVTGREERELEKIVIAVVAGAIPKNALRAIRALMDAIFIAQDLLFYEDTIHAYEEALREFHIYSNDIKLAGGRQGKRGMIDHFQIPKLGCSKSSLAVYALWGLHISGPLMSRRGAISLM